MKIYKVCRECAGSGQGYSNCCDSEIDNGRCISCGRFCKNNICYECEGSGSFEIEKKSEVEFYVNKDSPKYLKAQLKKRKTYRGIVKFIIDKETVLVRLSSKLVAVKINDIDVP